VVALAVFLNGLLLWDLLAHGAMQGGRGALTGLTACALLLLLGITYRARLLPAARTLVALLVAQVVILLAALQVSSDAHYGVWKVQGFIIFAVLPAMLVLWVVPRKPQLVRALYLTIAALAALPLLLLLPLGLDTLMAGERAPWILRQQGFDTIGLSRALGIGAFLLLAFAFHWRGLMRLGALGGAGLFTLAQFWLGQRGPVVALLAGLVYLALIRYPVRARVRLGRGSRIALVLGLLVVAVLVLPRVLPRIKLDTVVSDPRVLIAQRWGGMFLEHPLLGIGVGSFSYGDTSETDSDHAYAHNIFGELLSETGLLGFLAFIAFVVIAYRYARRARAPGLDGEPLFLHQASLGLSAYALVAAQVSGDLTTNYMVWVSLALVYATAVPRVARATAPAKTPEAWEGVPSWARR
jgi:O-antigen ligase